MATEKILPALVDPLVALIKLLRRKLFSPSKKVGSTCQDCPNGRDALIDALPLDTGILPTLGPMVKELSKGDTAKDFAHGLKNIDPKNRYKGTGLEDLLE